MTSQNHEWKESMGEISGFGGGYEAVCRAMVVAGIAWVDSHPDSSLDFKAFKNIFGIITEENDAAKQLVEAMMEAPVYYDGKLLQKRVRDDCTGAMHHAAVNHVIAYKRLGWDEYVRQLEEEERKP